MSQFEQTLSTRLDEQDTVLGSYDEILCDKAQKHTVKELQTQTEKRC